MARRAVYKSSAVEALDDFFSGTEIDLESAFSESVDRIGQDDVPLWEVTERHVSEGQGPQLTQEDAERFRDNWIADESRFGGQNVDRVVRQAYKQAVELAGTYDEPVPIETFWATGTGPGFEIHVCQGRSHVMVLWFVPVERKYGSERARSQSFVIRALDPDPPADVMDDGDPPIVRSQKSGQQAGSSF